jgi:ubiquitin-conjugating enzyme E2 L3
VTLKTKIYHPNIDEKGQICLPIVAAENWKPATKVEHVLLSLIGLIESPEVDHPLRSELAQEYLKEKGKFMKAAAEFTKKFAEPR